jgi:acylphosphatase
MTRRRVLIHGFVQGVYFRDTLRRRAGSLGVSGWARNNPDGTVEAVFEGEPDAVERMLALSREGPRGARVDRIEVFEEDATGGAGFSIR